MNDLICPECKEEAVLVSRAFGEYESVHCYPCGLATEVFPNMELAIDAWKKGNIVEGNKK